MPRALVLLAALALPGCALLAPPPVPLETPSLQPVPVGGHTTNHHAPDGGFRNPWAVETDAVPPLKAAGWMLSFPLRGRPEGGPAPAVAVDRAALDRPPGEGVRVTWVGHSSVLVQFPATAAAPEGVNLLLDPIFSERCSPFGWAGPRRDVRPALDVATLPRIDLVAISHDHYDHLDAASVQALEARFSPLWLVPLGVDGRLGDWLENPRVAAFDWYHRLETHGLAVTATPARHFSGRSAFDRDATLWAGWHVGPAEGAGPTVLYLGDTGYGPLFRTMGEALPRADVAIVPIGAYAPRWFMARVHVDPEDAVRAFVDTGATHFVPVHWGTFVLTEEPRDEPPRLTAEAFRAQGLDPARLHVLPVGGTVALGAGP